MGKIKKILENELIGGTQSTDVYPVTSTQAVYDENNRRLSDFVFDKNDVVNNLTDGGEAKALSAEMGKKLQSSVDEVVVEQSVLTNDVLTNRNDIEELQNTVNTHNTKFSLLDDDIEALQQDKQDKLAHYTEEDENATIVTRETISIHTERQEGIAGVSFDATTSEVEMHSTNNNAENARVYLNNGNISIDADVKVSMSCDRGETVIEDVVGTIKEIVDYMAKDETDDDQINVALNQHEARLGELTDSVQMLQDETEDLQSMRDTIDRLDTDKADKSALEAINKTVEGKQDTLQTYEEATDKAEVKMPNGNSYIRVTKDSAGMYAQDGKSGIVNSSNGSRLVYQETATDSSGSSYTSHRDDISIGKHDGDNNATHITMTSKSTTEEAGEKITNTSTIQVNPDGISMSSPEGEISDVVKEISGKASSKSVSNLRQEVDAKAPKVGYAPDLKVNFAKELVGRGEATPEVIGGIRPTGVRSIGDGNATIERIKGESVVWNQLNKRPQGNGTIYADKTYCNAALSASVKEGVYCIKCHIDTDVVIKSARILVWDGSSNHPTPQIDVSDNTLYYIVRIPKAGTGILNLYYDTIDENKPFTSVGYIHDLSKMFGADNEPTTIEEFEARKPLGVTNEYNEGTIVSYDGDALKSVGFNAWDEEWELGSFFNGKKVETTSTWRNKNDIVVVPNRQYRFEIGSPIYINVFDRYGNYLYAQRIAESNSKTFNKNEHHIWIRPYDDILTYNNDICLHIVHSGYRNEEYAPYEADIHPLPDVKSILDAEGNQLFPYGLLSAGSVHDEITATKAIKRVGVVDMGTLNWGRFAETDRYIFQATPAGIGVYSDTTSVPNLLNKVYPSVLRADIKTTDKCISQHNGAKALIIRDDAYTDVTSFKAAMSGVLLYYELAEPIEVDLPEELNMTYEAWDFGTEELVAKGATTPLNADIVYQFNAVDRIRENSSAIDALEEHVEERKNDDIELLANGNLKLTLKGETREFMPATPSGDPMHWAYVSAGAEYNDTGEDKVKDAPWAALADTDEEKKVTHKAGCWYLSGVGDMTNDDIRYSYINRTLLYDLNRRASFSSDTALRTIYPVHRGSSVSGLGPTKASTLFKCTKLKTCLLSNMQGVRQEHDYSLSLSASYEFYQCTALKAIGQVTPTNTDINRFAHCTSLRYIWIYELKVSLNLKDSSLISKLSVKYMIDNATPTSAITITLHADAYARLVDDTDIKTALETKNAALASTGGSISLVSA